VILTERKYEKVMPEAMDICEVIEAMLTERKYSTYVEVLPEAMGRRVSARL
jgi:hypothetical protein